MSGSVSSSGSEYTGNEDDESFASSSNSNHSNMEDEGDEDIPIIDLSDSELEETRRVAQFRKNETGGDGNVREDEIEMATGDNLQTSRAAAPVVEGDSANVESEFDDLYGDLEVYVFQRSDQPERKSHMELTALVLEMESRLIDSYKVISDLRMKLKSLSNSHNIALKNASSLYNTAREQVSKKNKMLTLLQKKLQELRHKCGYPSDSISTQNTKEIDPLKMDYFATPIPKPAFKYLCQEARSKSNDGKEQSDIQTQLWSKKFRYQNVSYYFYSHTGDFNQKGIATDIEYDDGISTVSNLVPQHPDVETSKVTTSLPIISDNNAGSSNGTTLKLPDPVSAERRDRSRSDSGELSGSDRDENKDLAQTNTGSSAPRSAGRNRRESKDRSRSDDKKSPRERCSRDKQRSTPEHHGDHRYHSRKSDLDIRKRSRSHCRSRSRDRIDPRQRSHRLYDGQLYPKSNISNRSRNNSRRDGYYDRKYDRSK